jgi:hypothetical protein
MSDSNCTPYEPSYSVSEFSTAERISKVKLYELWNQGTGPRYYYNGRCRRITHRARLEWQTQMEAEAAAEMEHA